MSLNVQRNRTTFSCSFRMGAIFTKNQTGVPESTKKSTHLAASPAYYKGGKFQSVHIEQKSWFHSVVEMFRTLEMLPAAAAGNKQAHIFAERGSSGLALNQLVRFKEVEMFWATFELSCMLQRLWIHLHDEETVEVLSFHACWSRYSLFFLYISISNEFIS